MVIEQNKFYELLKEKEQLIDTEIEALSLWKYSFQTVYLNLLYLAEKVDIDGNGDSAMDYFARTAAIFGLVRDKCQGHDSYGTTWNALSQTLKDKQFFVDMETLYAYGHFSMLMPQIHRTVFQIDKKSETSFNLSFQTAEMLEAEKKDRLLSILSQQLSIQYIRQRELDQYFMEKIKIGNTELEDYDIHWMTDMYQFNIKHRYRTEILSDAVLSETIGITNADYDHFCSSIRACSDFLLTFGRAFKTLSDKISDEQKEEKEQLFGEYLEWTTCTLMYQILEIMIDLSGLSETKFKTLLSYYCQIYIGVPDTSYSENAFCGDGYLPPFLLMPERVIFSPLAIRYLYTFDNLLYSVNKRQNALFANTISKNLEPNLISQIHRNFSNFQNLNGKKNIPIPGGEIDYIVLCEEQYVCITFQVKATLSPSSSRTVSRVESRSLEGIEQINHFEGLDKQVQLQTINGAFGKTFKKLNFINILLLRSCAGSEKVWTSGVTITNYHLLTGLLGRKLKNGDYNFSSFGKELDEYLDEMLALSKPEVNEEKLVIDDITIKFPDITFDDIKAKCKNFQDCNNIKDFQSAV